MSFVSKAFSSTWASVSKALFNMLISQYIGWVGCWMKIKSVVGINWPNEWVLVKRQKTLSFLFVRIL